MLTTLRARLFLASSAVLLCAVVLELALVWHEVGGYFVRTPAARVSTSLSRADGLLGASVVDPTNRPALLNTLTRLVAEVGGGFAFLPARGTGEVGFRTGVPAPTLALLPRAVRPQVLSGTSWSGTADGGNIAVQAMPAIWSGRVQGILVWERRVAGRGGGEVGVVDREAELPAVVLEQPPRPPVDVVDGDDPAPRRQRLEERGERAEAGGEGERPGAAFETSERPFEIGAGRVPRPAVDVPLVDVRGPLAEGAREVDRRRDRPGRRIGRLAVVDDPGAKPHARLPAPKGTLRRRAA